MPIWKRVVMRSKNPTKWKKTRTFENNIYFIINNYLAILKIIIIFHTCLKK